jgi:hypothetical protein
MELPNPTARVRCGVTGQRPVSPVWVGPATILVEGHLGDTSESCMVHVNNSPVITSEGVFRQWYAL